MIAWNVKVSKETLKNDVLLYRIYIFKYVKILRKFLNEKSNYIVVGVTVPTRNYQKWAKIGHIWLEIKFFG